MWAHSRGPWVCNDGKVQTNEAFASGFKSPSGIAFYPQTKSSICVYQRRNSLVRFPYKNGDLTASGLDEPIVTNIPKGGSHWTRALAFSNDGKKLYVGVDRMRTFADDEAEQIAPLSRFNPDGRGSGSIRRAFGMDGFTVHPKTASYGSL